MREEQREVIPLLTSCYGQAGLYVRCLPGAPESLSGNLLQQVVHLYREGRGLAGDLRCDEDSLPLQRDSLDLVYLLHMLETCEDPRSLLAEVERVLTPEGQLMLVVLNPMSMMRLRWAGTGLRATGAAECRTRLHEAGLEVVRQVGLGPVWPWQRADSWLEMSDTQRRDPWAAWRGGYLLQARKRRRTLTPLRARTGAVAFEPGMHPG